MRALVLLPMVLPPVVGGVALLLAFGRTGVAGRWLDRAFGITLPFSTAGAILAETFVAMPFLVITVGGRPPRLDRRYEDAAATLGAGRWTVFRRVTLPLIAPALGAGAASGLGARPRRVRRHHHLRRQPARHAPRRCRWPSTSRCRTTPDAAIALSLVLLAISLTVLVALRGRWFPAR